MASKGFTRLRLKLEFYNSSSVSQARELLEECVSRRLDLNNPPTARWWYFRLFCAKPFHTQAFTACSERSLHSAGSLKAETLRVPWLNCQGGAKNATAANVALRRASQTLVFAVARVSSLAISILSCYRFGLALLNRSKVFRVLAVLDHPKVEEALTDPREGRVYVGFAGHPT